MSRSAAPDVGIITTGHDVADARLHKITAALQHRDLRVEKAVRLTGRTWLCGGEDQLAAQAGQLGRPQSPTKGRYHKETETAA